MVYNEKLYDRSAYDLTNYTSTLTETITPSDATITKSISVVKTDSQASADVLSDAESLAAFLETITILQRAHTPFAYNTGTYNQYMYNLRLDEDEILLRATKALLDSVTSSDAIGPFVTMKSLSDTITDIDALSFIPSRSFFDFIFFSEFFRIEITNKALSDTIRMNDWFQVEHKPFVEYWGE